jgi:hypothetical protein
VDVEEAKEEEEVARKFVSLEEFCPSDDLY